MMSPSKRHTWIIALLIAVLMLAGCGSVNSEPDARLLFVGNSFTFFHDMDQMTAELVAGAREDWDQVEAERVAQGGARLTDHAQALGDPNSPLSQALDQSWDLVVLQEQSQIPGFPRDQAEWEQSANALATLINRANTVSAGVMTYMTWGYRSGDSRNPDLYGDFLTMQERLAGGYFAYQDVAFSDVAPVGLAFQMVYEDEQARGISPTSPESRFWQLYDSDGQHPSLAGSYLAAAVIAADFTELPVSGVDYVPRGLDPDLAAYLRQVADRTALQ